MAVCEGKRKLLFHMDVEGRQDEQEFENQKPDPRFPWISWVYRAYPVPAMAAVIFGRGGGVQGYPPRFS
jgi:hypothetical protein